MKLRQKSKRDQTLDAAASVAKTWSEWRLGEKVAKSASKAAKTTGRATKKAKKTGASSGGRAKLKIAGAVALIGGIGAAVARKLTGGKAEPLYTPRGPAPDMAPPPPSPVAVGDLAGGAPPPSDLPTPPPTIEPAHFASTETPEADPTPVVLEDLASDAPAAAAAEEAPAAAEEQPDFAEVPSGADDLEPADPAAAEPAEAEAAADDDDDEDKA